VDKLGLLDIAAIYKYYSNSKRRGQEQEQEVIQIAQTDLNERWHSPGLVFDPAAVHHCNGSCMKRGER